MDYSDLEKLGLNRNEARVFRSLLRNGPSFPSELVRITGFHRNIIYDNLDKLVERGLVGYILEEGKRKYTASPPESLIEMLEKEQYDLDSRKKIAKLMVPEIESELKKTKKAQTAVLFRGVKSFKAILREVLYSGEYRGMGVSNASVSVMGSDFWKNFISQVEKKKVREKLLLNHDFDKSSIPINRPKFTESRSLPEQFDLVTEIMIYGEKVAIMVYTDPPIATVIQDQYVTESFTRYFDYLWASSKS